VTFALVERSFKPDAPAQGVDRGSHPGDVGALIVHTDAEMHGVEVEISPAGDDLARGHKEVLERCIDGRPAFTAVFDGLTAGGYTLWVNGSARSRDVSVAGGGVAELDWRAERRAPRSDA
jgi:hypothetical protein